MSAEKVFGLCLAAALGFSAIPSSSVASEAPMHAGELAHVLDRLANTTRVLYVAAHPDDENTRLLAYLAQHRHANVAYLSITRGGGGQNLIGAEQGELLDVIRTEELLAARRIDGAEQFFTRMRDFGYSKSAEETLRIWGPEEALADVVRVVRSFQPDVIITRFDETPPNHGHHIASAILAREAFEAAADPARFPELGLEPWAATRLVHNVSTWRGPPPPDAMPLDVGVYDPRLGLDVGEVAAISRSQHKSQGFGATHERGALIEHFSHVAGARPEEDVLEGVPSSWAARYGAGPAIAAVGVGAEVGRASAASRRPGPSPAKAAPAAAAASPEAGAAGSGSLLPADASASAAAEPAILEAARRLDEALAEARERLHRDHPERALPALLRARAALAQLPPSPRTRAGVEALEAVIRGAAGVFVRATAEAPTAVPGGTIELKVEALSRRADANLERIRFADGSSLSPGVRLGKGRRVVVEKSLELSQDAHASVPYWLRTSKEDGRYQVEEGDLIGSPRSPAAQRVEVELALGGERLRVEVPVVYAWTDRVHGERVRPFSIVPPATVSPSREAVLLRGREGGRLALRVRAGADGLKAKVGLELPEGWIANPKVQALELAKAGEERTLHFELRAPAGAGPADVRPFVEVGGRRWSLREDLIDYEHIPVQLVLQPASVRLVPLELTLPDGLIGYVEGSGDSIPEDLLHAGARVERIDDEELRAGDLNRYAAIVVGIRAYNVRPALLAAHHRLMRYVEEGGVVVVQYVTVSRWALIEPVRDDWVDTGVGPWPIELGSGRVTDERAKVELLQADHPLLVGPNRIGPADFEGWVQERGLYFASRWDERYQPLFRLADPGEDPRDGSTLVANYGKGRYVYTGLSFFRQLRAGVPGAYRLFANLVSPP